MASAAAIDGGRRKRGGHRFRTARPPKLFVGDRLGRDRAPLKAGNAIFNAADRLRRALALVLALRP